MLVYKALGLKIQPFAPEHKVNISFVFCKFVGSFIIMNVSVSDAL